MGFNSGFKGLKFLCKVLLSISQFNSPVITNGPKEVLTLVVILAVLLLWSNDPYGKGKGKAIPLQAWTGPEGSRRLRLPDFKTFGT